MFKTVSPLVGVQTSYIERDLQQGIQVLGRVSGFMGLQWLFLCCMQIFFQEHDPSRRAYKPQYKSAIWTHSPEQEKVAREAAAEISRISKRPVVTDIAPAGPWFDAEEFHQKYYEKSRGSAMCRFK